ncbi:hypothetical protein [Natronoflexus pectinivorans]|uniref:Uncharacterized protein n=1 Tax=Natronoflexus pectinivorans TaxID=682526 RepID=A0A4R2GQJ0_9BACT|nr:hypothetical protein [Natronoflexus pectinivorans]TCO10999.1 hypothetical protein EV194_101633 [Natronoflexus pectinivorans]
MAFRSFAFYDGNTDNLPATGFGFKINRIVFGTAIADNNPSFSLLYNAFVIETTPGFRQIFQIGASLIFAEYVNVFGGHLNFNQLLPLIPNAPSSLNVGASLYKYNQTFSGWGLSASEYSNTTPTVTFGIKQAIFSHLFIYPVFGAS